MSSVPAPSSAALAGKAPRQGPPARWARCDVVTPLREDVWAARSGRSLSPTRTRSRADAMTSTSLSRPGACTTGGRSPGLLDTPFGGVPDRHRRHLAFTFGLVEQVDAHRSVPATRSLSSRLPHLGPTLAAWVVVAGRLTEPAVIEAAAGPESVRHSVGDAVQEAAVAPPESLDDVHRGVYRGGHSLDVERRPRLPSRRFAPAP